VLIDALLRRLGEGIPTNASSLSRSEEEGIGADEEEGGELAPEAPDFEALAKACRGKLRRLIKRMMGQFELAKAQDRARRGIVQLAAVLGVIRALRFIERRPEWRRSRLELVDRADEWSIFQAAVIAIAWGPGALAARAVAETGGEGFAELSMVVGLLAWLAWDVEINISAAAQGDGIQGAEKEQWIAIQLLAALGVWLVDDSFAQSILEESIAHTPHFRMDEERWLRCHLEALEAFAMVSASPEGACKFGRAVKSGDLVLLHPNEAPRVRVVLDVVEGGDGGKMSVFDPDRRDGFRTFLVSRMPTLPWSVSISATAVAS
jgi:hypothetical protein